MHSVLLLATRPLEDEELLIGELGREGEGVGERGPEGERAGARGGGGGGEKGAVGGGGGRLSSISAERPSAIS